MAGGIFPEEKPPYGKTVEKQFIEVVVDGETYQLELSDQDGSEESSRLRALHYFHLQPNVVLVLFSISNPRSVTSVRMDWYPEVSHYSPNTPIILVGTKAELRHDPDTIEASLRRHCNPPVTYKQGILHMEDCHMDSYQEISSARFEGLPKLVKQIVICHRSTQLQGP